MVDSNVRVAVRVRPMNQREIDIKAECVVHMEGKRTVLKSTSPTYDGSSTTQKEFIFDDCFWSVNDDGPAKYMSQEDIFKTLGEDIINSIFAGFNSCIFAYGQTGSGKTFSMMGTDDQPGLVPRICSALFSRDINHLQNLQVEAAYLEIYNEKVQDLLHPTSNLKALRVREHKSFGPYVEGLSHHAVRNTEDIKSLILEGNKCRKIANTKMNEQSSRSHAIFTLTVTQTLQNEQGVLKELLSKVSLVDLAGSERTSKSGATGDRMKESNNINKSLTSLGLVINSLAELSEGRRRSSYVNYRDSTLTWLLKNNLGGNSKTVMLATISPTSDHYQETLSTLKYADSAKRIVNKAKVNEDIKSKAITELKEEVTRLREQLQQAKAKHKHELEAKLHESEKLLRDLNVSWEEKLRKTETSALERQKELQRLGITVEHTGIRVDADKCYLISIGISNQNNLLLYNLGEKTKIGAGDSQDIQLTGPGIELEHCVIDILQNGEVFLNPNKNAETFVNSSRVQTVVMLSHEDKIQIGNKVSFMLHKPNTNPNITQEGADVVHNVPSIQPEERNREDNETINEESDSSIGSDNVQCSYGESTDSVMWTSSSDAGSIDSSDQKSIVSPESSDTKQSEDRDSYERKITTIETIKSPKKHKKDEGNSEVNLNTENKKSNDDDTINNDEEDDRMEISNSTSQTEIKQDFKSQNEIYKEYDRSDISLNLSQTEVEEHLRSQNEISKKDDVTCIFIRTKSETETEQNISNENKISKDYDNSDISVIPTSQTEVEQHLRSQNQISKEEDKTDISINQNSQIVITQNLKDKTQMSRDDDNANIFMNLTCQTEVEQNINSENQISKDDDKTDMCINPTSQTETEQNKSSEKETSEKEDKADISITPTSQTEVEQHLRSQNQIPKEDDRTDICTNPTSQTEMELNLSSEKQVSQDDDKTDICIRQTPETEKEQNILSSEKEISKDNDKTDISIKPTSQTEEEQHLRSQNQISKNDDRTDISINPTSQTEKEQCLSTENQKSKEDDRSDICINSTCPSAELSIEDNQEMTRASMGAVPSETAAGYIRRSRKEIMAVLQEDIDDWMDEFDSRNMITPEEYFTIEKITKNKDKARALLNIILQKDETTCKTFLQCLQLKQDDVIASEYEETHVPDENLKKESKTKEEENIPDQEAKKSHIEEPAVVNTDKDDVTASEYEETHVPDENLKKESKTKDKRTCFQDLLEKIEFQHYRMSRLTLHEVLDIGAECLTPGGFPMENAAWYFIRKLMALHEEARNISTIGNRGEMSRDNSLMLDVDDDLSGTIHPLDLQCAIFHCSDHFLQQEMISKLSMCQFSVPLLLPAADGSDFTLMLWAMRGIVKKWRPQSLAESKGFREEHLVTISMPTFSFVGLGNCRLSKSKILNQILSSTQHCQDIFIHRDMEGGNVERTISSGLVEISWYFPAGKGIFAEPVAFTNLRGELESHLKQFSFLAEISSIVVVFAETISKTECELLLKYKSSKTTYLFIIAPEKQRSKEEMKEMLESVMSMPGIKKDNVLVIAKTTNEATTVKKIRSALLKMEKQNANYLSVEDMADIARKQKICEDKNKAECQTAEKEAREITEEISMDENVVECRTAEKEAREITQEISMDENVVECQAVEKEARAITEEISMDENVVECQAVEKEARAITEEISMDENVVECQAVEKEARAITEEISMDENVVECQAAEKEAREITKEICDVVKYKRKTMKLQGQLLKDLSRLEKEMCQMKNQENKNGEKYKSELRRQCNEIRRKQWKCEIPGGIVNFIKAIETSNSSKKFYFLSWLKYYLDFAARKTLTSLQEHYKEKYSQARDYKELTEIDQKISDSSLGIEHFLREVSQIYEVWHFMGENIECSHLSETAANLLLDGYPLELIDGDASRIPVQWVTDVLNKVNSKTGGRSRIRVITVLGVQSTGKSTLLNTMFGLQFPVASGRCTRGAFMTLIKVKENFRDEMDCEFLLVIDTEGLKAPELDSLEGSYQHDNELATLVVALSDITVINMSMENTTEMKDILQIVIHAFLRMKEIGKKPNCQFVHQNVSDVSAPVMNMRDRNKLLEQLNEMTRTVATMEKKPQYKVFSDVMEYEAEQHHWYIPSLWQGVPPMAPVSAGYSESIAELKQHLLKLIKQKHNPAQTFPQFVTWIRDLWNAVKHENFIFSFRNSLVASAYNKLSMKFSELEWKFNKLIHEWFTNTETIIKNQSEDTLENEGRACCSKLENIISAEQNKMITWVEDYFKQEQDCVHLIRYKEDFIVSAKMLGKNLRRSSYEKFQNAIHMQKQQHNIKRVSLQYIEKIERKVSSLMEECRKKRHELDEAMMKEEFEMMWQSTVQELEVKPLVTRDIEKDMMEELFKTMRDKGSAVNEKLNQINHLPKPDEKQKGGRIREWFSYIKETWWKKIQKHEDSSQSVLKKCCKYSEEQARRDADYDDTYCKHLLNMIDDFIIEDGNIPAEQELEIKLKILGHTVTDFQEMHNNFIKKNDFQSQLETLKAEYLDTFMNVFQEKNESQNLAKRICDTCLKPAIIDRTIKNLGIELVDDIIGSEGSKTYTSRTFFQYTVLLNLLEENNFRKYVEYSRNYEDFVKNWILEYIIAKYKNFNTIQSKILSGITKKIGDLLNNPETWDHSENVKDFLYCFQKKLSSDLVFPQEKIKAIILQNSANTKEFITNLNNFLTDTKEEITAEIESLSMEEMLSRVTVKPEDELFKKVFGCGEQCPFCAVPCEAGGKNHKEHFASVHRPEGLGSYRFIRSSVLSHDICTTSVCGDGTFRNRDTNETFHPFKKYQDIYPDWKIQPDSSIEASDYWKFVLKEFNEQFAEEYEAKPAEYPKEWNSLTKDMAQESLRKTFNM